MSEHKNPLDECGSTPAYRDRESTSKGTSKVVVLCNMVVSQQTDDDDIREQIRGDCSKNGDIDRLYIHTLQDGEVRVFVLFTSAETASKTVKAMDGKCFHDRYVMARFYPESRFNAKAYDEEIF